MLCVAVARLQIHYLNLLLGFNVLFSTRKYSVKRLRNNKNLVKFFKNLSENFFLSFKRKKERKNRSIIMLSMIPREEGWFEKTEHVDNTWHILRSAIQHICQYFFFACGPSAKRRKKFTNWIDYSCRRVLELDVCLKKSMTPAAVHLSKKILFFI